MSYKVRQLFDTTSSTYTYLLYANNEAVIIDPVCVIMLILLFFRSSYAFLSFILYSFHYNYCNSAKSPKTGETTLQETQS